MRKSQKGVFGLLISQVFDECGIVTSDIYRKLLFGKLEANVGMLVENVVAQMLVASWHHLFAALHDTVAIVLFSIPLSTSPFPPKYLNY